MQNSHISLSTIPACIRPGDPIVINWRLEGLTVSKYDWIGVYTSSRCSSSRCPPYPDASDPALAKTNSRSLNWGGSAVLTVHKVDTYRAYYFASNKYEIAATSNTFIVSTTCPPIYQLAIIEKQKCFTPKSLIHFSWNSTHSAEAMGWVGIYSLGQCIKTAVNGLSCPIESHFRSRINANSPKSLTSGNLSARIPFKALTYPPTTYFGYYLLNESRFAGAVSDGFVVRSNCPQDEPITLSDISLCIRPGDLIAVHWTSKEPASDRDWIGIYSTERCTNAIESRCPSGSDAWNYVSLSGGVSSRYSGYNYIIAPTSGSYQAYYFSNDMYSIKAISNTFTVSDSCPPLYNIATTDAECYTVDSVIKFEWSALPGAGPADWIGVYGSNSCEPGIGSKCPPGSKWWLPLSKSVSGSKTQGVLSMKIPSTALADPPSVYRGYFMLNDMYTVAAYSNSFAVRSSCTSNDLATTPVLSSVSNTVVAGGFMNVSWLNSSTANMDDRIMFTISDHPSETNYLSDCWQYTYGDTIQRHQSPPKAGSVSIKAPAIPGSYKVYYCLNNGFNCPSSLDIIVTEPVVTCLGTGETASNIKHVITIISENHSFDSYFGRYCQAPFGTNPACHTGPSCCEAFNPIPGLNPTLLNDVQNIAFDPCHSQECEICEMNGGLMDSYTASQNKTCPGANDRNFAIADGSTGSANQYWKWAHRYAMSDRFFQSTPGASSQGEMYFARGAYVFQDNSKVPASSIGRGTACKGENCVFYDDPTVGDLLQKCGISMRFYHVGWPKDADVSDDAFLYYPSLSNGLNATSIFVPFEQLAVDIENMNLPSVAFIKGDYHGYQNNGGQTEHPGGSISDGELFNAGIIELILSSSQYKDNTVIFLVPDESGGYRDSQTPPPRSIVDNKPYGPRTPFLAVGNMVKSNYISHVITEPASLVRFIESNWFADDKPGQLQTRDAVAGSLNDLFDEAAVGFVFP